MKIVKILDENDRVIKTIEIPAEAQITFALIESLFGRKLKKGEAIECNSRPPVSARFNQNY